MKKKELVNRGKWVLMLFALIVFSACGSDAGEEGGAPPATRAKAVSGTIEKGPFVQGSKVTLYELKNDLTQTGKSFKAQTTNHLGEFRIDGIELDGQYVELETNGYFYNEVKGETSVAPITLNALSDVTSRSSVNVNIITHLEYERVKKLVKEGSSFDSAKRQAEKELLKCFAITDEISTPEGVSITDNNRNASILLAISAIMLYNRSEGELTAFLAKFMTDFADNGLIDDLTIRDGIKEGQENVHPSDVIDKMQEYYGKQNVAINCEDFSRYIDFNGDGVIDDEDAELDDNNYPDEYNVTFSEGQVRQTLMDMYNMLGQFVNLQISIERSRLGYGNSSINTSSAYDNTLYETWENAYQVIGMANNVIRVLTQRDLNTMSDTTLPYYYGEALAIRSFVYYQLAVLWGNVPVLTGDEGIMDCVPQKRQGEVLNFVLNDLNIANNMFGVIVPWGNKEHFSEGNVCVLLAEVLLTLQKKAQAQQLLQVAENKDCNLDIMGFPIYEFDFLELIKEETSGNTAELANRWQSLIGRYGVWAALKRLGVAQQVASCSDYELLLPIPERELVTNPMLVQNPGY